MSVKNDWSTEKSCDLAALGVLGCGPERRRDRVRATCDRGAEGTDLRVEVTLTSSVDAASVETAVNPDRILIDLPGTTCNACTQNVSVSAGGIRRVRTGQHSTKPMITRVVVDLDQAHPYTLRTEGNRVILTVGPAENAHFETHGAPVAATSGNLVAVFRKKRETAPPPVVDNNTAYVPPPTPPPTPLWRRRRRGGRNVGHVVVYHGRRRGLPFCGICRPGFPLWRLPALQSTFSAGPTVRITRLPSVP